jgi:IstB-like ATP binding protein
MNRTNLLLTVAHGPRPGTHVMDRRPRQLAPRRPALSRPKIEITVAMIDRLVHHAEVISFKGDSYRLKDRDLGRVPAAITDDT